MQGNRPFASGRNRINGKFRTCINVTTYEDIRFGSLVSQFISKCTAVRTEFHMKIIQHMSPIDCLSYWENDMAARHSYCIVLIIFRWKSALCIKYAGTFFENNTAYMTVFFQNFFWSPATVQIDSLFQCPFDFLIACRHFFSCFQTEHGNLCISTSAADSCRVNGYVSATNYNNITFKRKTLFCTGFS